MSRPSSFPCFKSPEINRLAVVMSSASHRSSEASKVCWHERGVDVNFYSRGINGDAPIEVCSD